MQTIETRTVTKGKRGTRVRKDMYDLFRKTILAATPRTKTGITFRDLVRRVGERLDGRDFNAKGSVSWYTTTIKLDLEARGLIERIPGTRPQRLRRVRGQPR